MKCPNCGKEMDDGYLTIPMHALYSIKWSQTPGHRYVGGDIVYDPKREGSLWHYGMKGTSISAQRCRECRCVLFYYPPHDQSS